MNKIIKTGSVLVVFVFMAFFSSGVGVYADSSASTDTEVQLNVSTVINISTPDTTTINCASLNTLCTANTSVTVGTNNITGYTLQLNATSGYSNSLTNAATSETIPTLTGAYAAGSFPTNYWGYTGGLDKSGETGGLNCSANYCPILAYQSNDSNYAPNHAIKVTDSPAVSSNTTITFGAKADITKPSGTYSTSVTFTAITNEVPITTMQDFNSIACANATTDQTFTLTDTRDNTEYTIAKLRDGNCWMTQNLALGSSTAMTLTPANTNIASNFTLPASVAEGSWTGSRDDPEFFDYAGNYPSQQAFNKYGNYYNWPAATAGSGTSATTSGDVQYSICPKNWHLPNKNEQQALINNYSELSTPEPTAYTAAPLSLIFSGACRSSCFGQEEWGWWWSSTAWGSYDTYGLWVDVDLGVYEESYDSHVKNDGNSVRCLISGS